MLAGLWAVIRGDPLKWALYAAIAAVVLALWVRTGMLASQRDNARAELATEQADRAKEKAAALAASLAAEKRVRDLETQWREATDSARGVLEDEKRKNAQLAAELDRAGRDRAASTALADRLRQQLQSYAISPAGGEDSAPACQARAAALAEATSRGVELLERTRFEDRLLLRQLAQERDDFAAEVTACVTAWPKNQGQ